MIHGKQVGTKAFGESPGFNCRHPMSPSKAPLDPASIARGALSIVENGSWEIYLLGHASGKEHRNLALGAGLVIGIWGERRHCSVPPDRSLVPV